jgi:hypothetical protein
LSPGLPSQTPNLAGPATFKAIQRVDGYRANLAN